MKKPPLTLAEKIEQKKKAIAKSRKALAELNVSERKASSRRDRRKKMILGEAFLTVLMDPESQGAFLMMEERLIAEMSERDAEWYNQNRDGAEPGIPPLPQTPPPASPAKQENGDLPSQNQP